MNNLVPVENRHVISIWEHPHAKFLFVIVFREWQKATCVEMRTMTIVRDECTVNIYV